MVVVERLTQTISMERWSELDAVDKKWDAVESRLGFPPKKRYQALAGGFDANTIFIERQWESLAQMEAAYEKANQDPEYLALFPTTAGIVLSNRLELFSVLP